MIHKIIIDFEFVEMMKSCFFDNEIKQLVKAIKSVDGGSDEKRYLINYKVCKIQESMKYQNGQRTNSSD